MTDKNGKEIKTGNVVVVSGGYFKSDNGMYKVAHSPGDENWLGSDYSLIKLNKNRTESRCKYRIAFWPLTITVNDHSKYIEAKKHNAENAQIEVI